MPRFLAYLWLDNKLEAIAKMMLLLRQGQISMISASMVPYGEGGLLATLLLDGKAEKLGWFSKKVLNFPYFHSCSYMPISKGADGEVDE